MGGGGTGGSIGPTATATERSTDVKSVSKATVIEEVNHVDHTITRMLHARARRIFPDWLAVSAARRTSQPFAALPSPAPRGRGFVPVRFR